MIRSKWRAKGMEVGRMAMKKKKKCGHICGEVGRAL